MRCLKNITRAHHNLVAGPEGGVDGIDVRRAAHERREHHVHVHLARELQVVSVAL